MKTLLMSECIDITGSHPPANLPDYSILLGIYDTSIFNILKAEKLQHSFRIQNSEYNFQPTQKVKKDLKKINEAFFMSDEVKAEVQATITKLENGIHNQIQLDQLWYEIKNSLLKGAK